MKVTELVFSFISYSPAHIFRIKFSSKKCFYNVIQNYVSEQNNTIINNKEAFSFLGTEQV